MCVMNLRQLAFGFVGGVLLAGCSPPPAPFVRYETVAHKIQDEQGVPFSANQRQNIDETLQALFGTSDEPQLPVVEGVELGQLMSLSRLKLAAGRVGSDEHGTPR